MYPTSVIDGVRLHSVNLSLAGVTEMLVRAKSVPLYLEARDSLDCRYDVARFNMLQEELPAHIPRICHLSISIEPHCLRSTLERLVSPAPTLEYLSLRARGTDGAFIPDTFFDGFTPRLSYLELEDCSISWKSPLLRGLKYLKILTPPQYTTPFLAVWLDALDEMPQLKTLTLHSASPDILHIPFEVERTIMLPFLTHLDISAYAKNCALALAHLFLPALTWLCIKVIHPLPNDSEVQNLLSYVARHAHGSQDTQPLQSVLIHKDRYRLDILAWPLPDIDVDVYDPPALIGRDAPHTRDTRL